MKPVRLMPQPLYEHDKSGAVPMIERVQIISGKY